MILFVVILVSALCVLLCFGLTSLALFFLKKASLPIALPFALSEAWRWTLHCAATAIASSVLMYVYWFSHQYYGGNALSKIAIWSCCAVTGLLWLAWLTVIAVRAMWR
jgi:hypothetical protein